MHLKGLRKHFVGCLVGLIAAIVIGGSESWLAMSQDMSAIPDTVIHFGFFLLLVLGLRMRPKYQH